MLTETGTVTAVNSDSLWIETIQQSTCGSCRARKGCGQRLLSNMGSGSASVKALIDKNDTTHYQVGDIVTMVIPEHIIVMSSLFVYCLPLALMLVFSVIAHTFFVADGVLILAGVMGLLVGAYLIHLHGIRHKDDRRFHPRVMLPEADSHDVAPALIVYSSDK